MGDPAIASLAQELQTFASVSLLNGFTVGPWACPLCFHRVSVFHLKQGECFIESEVRKRHCNTWMIGDVQILRPVVSKEVLEDQFVVKEAFLKTNF